MDAVRRAIRQRAKPQYRSGHAQKSPSDVSQHRRRTVGCGLLIVFAVFCTTLAVVSRRGDGDGSGSLGGAVSFFDKEPRTLAEFAERYKGVDSSDSARNTVLIALTSKEAVNITMNWVCWCRGLGLKFFVFASDPQAHQFLSSRGVPTYFNGTSKTANTKGVKYDPNNHSHVWARSGYEKMDAVLQVLNLGYDVFLSDVDLVILQNPWPHFLRDADLEYQVETPFMEVDVKPDIQINVGFFLARNTALMRDTFQRILSWKRQTNSVEQDIMNMIMRAKLENDEAVWLNYTEPFRDVPLSDEKVTLRMKPIPQFPSGGVVFNTIRRDRYLKLIDEGMEPVMVHFNLIFTNELKELCMRDKGYWRYDYESNTCSDHYTVDYTNPKGCNGSKA